MRVAINGLGRIGRSILRISHEREDTDLVAINDLFDNEALKYLIKYDTVMGPFKGELALDGDYLLRGSDRIQMFAEPDPVNLPSKELEIDVVIEATGVFCDRKSISKHLEAGAGRVILTVPA